MIKGRMNKLTEKPLNSELLRKMDAYWRGAE